MKTTLRSLFALLMSVASMMPNKTMAQTSFTSSPGSITITTGSIPTPYPSNITVSGLSGVIQKVTVSLNNLNVSAASDLYILLVGPGGQNFVIMSDAGGVTPWGTISLTLDDGGANGLSTSGQPIGTVKPADFLGLPADNYLSPAPASPNSPAPTGSSTFASVFNGTHPNGTWSLYVVDGGVNPGGTLGSWTITITTVCVNNPVVTNNNTPAIEACGKRYWMHAPGAH